MQNPAKNISIENACVEDENFSPTLPPRGFCWPDQTIEAAYSRRPGGIAALRAAATQTSATWNRESHYR